MLKMYKLIENKYVISRRWLHFTQLLLFKQTGKSKHTYTSNIMMIAVQKHSSVTHSPVNLKTA